MKTSEVQTMYNLNNNLSMNEAVKYLCDTAKTGLARFYPQTSDVLPYTATIKDRWELSGESLRYAAISQIGIARWVKYHPEDRACLPNLWPRIMNNHNRIEHIGDIALALWAGVTSGADNCEPLARALAANWRNQAKLCNAVELGWIVQGCTLAIIKRNDISSTLEPMLNEAKTRLVSLFELQHSLFRRHNRIGLEEIISKRIACFADQVYPTMALSTYGSCFDDDQSIEIAAQVVEKMCRFQGALGQWWWHYDVSHGNICEEYPVFSVHQDSMAPMAIMASDRVSKQNHMKEIEYGMRWLFGANELNENLVQMDQGIIWRDIEKREPAKLSRKVRSICSVSGLTGLHRLAGKCFVGFGINRECRPYHLGWILYAWADYEINQ